LNTIGFEKAEQFTFAAGVKHSLFDCAYKTGHRINKNYGVK